MPGLTIRNFANAVGGVFYNAGVPYDSTGALLADLTAYQTLLTNSAGLAAALSDETGTGLAVFNNSPTLITPVLGVASATSLTNPLLVGGTAVGSNIISKSTTGIGTPGGIAHQFVGGTDGATVAATILNNGDVGIGTATPQSLLHVGDVSGTVRIGSNFATGDTAAGKLNFVNISGGTFELGAIEAKSNAVSGNYGDLLFKTGTASSAATEKMRISYNGNVGIGTIAPNANALLDIVSTTKAFMPPRMTTAQRDLVAAPTAGMVIYNSTTNKLNLFTTVWEAITSA